MQGHLHKGGQLAPGCMQGVLQKGGREQIRSAQDCEPALDRIAIATVFQQPLEQILPPPHDIPSMPLKMEKEEGRGKFLQEVKGGGGGGGRGLKS